MAEQQNGIFTEHGFYIGKDFAKSGTKDGKEWVLYKLKIKEDMAKQFPRMFNMFSSCKGLDTVKEGDYVKIGYVEEKPYYNEKAKKEITPRRVIFINKSEQQTPTNNISGETAAKSFQSDKRIVPDKIQSFVSKYILATQDNERNINHFCGVAFRTFYKQSEDFEKAFTANFNKPEPTLEETQAEEPVVEEEIVID